MKERPIIYSGPMIRAILDDRKIQTRRVMKPQPRVGGDYAQCTVCHKSKAPRGRDAPMAEANSYCNWGCRGYDKEPYGDHLWPGESLGDFGFPDDWMGPCPYGVPGDRLWVRETWQSGEGFTEPEAPAICYRADGAVYTTCDLSGETPYLLGRTSFTLGLESGSCRPRKWRSPIYMPRWASRCTLEITDVRVQRVQDISEDDCVAEGAIDPCDHSGAVMPGACEQCMNTGYSGDPLEYFHILWDSINAKKPGCSWDANPWIRAITFKRILQTETT